MNRVIGGWLTSGRSTVRSIMIPITTMATSVIAIAPQNGTPRSTRLTKVRAAKRTSAP